METNTFEEPVSILVGLGFPARVQTVAEAYAILLEWPGRRRNAAHEMALKACRAALSGEVDAETARGAFLAFARRSGMLTPDGDGVIAARATGAFGRQMPA